MGSFYWGASFWVLLQNVLNGRICGIVHGRDFWLLSEGFESLEGKVFVKLLVADLWLCSALPACGL